MSAQWEAKSVALHWVSAALVAALLTVGFVMSDLPAGSSLRLLLSRLHTLFGLTLMLLTVARLLVRWRGTRPEPLPVGPLHRRGVALIHGLIYATLFSLGASGLATAALTAWPGYLRGEGPLPELEHVASREVHETLVYVLLTLVALHVGGVLVQELRVGGTLRRMLPHRDRT